MAFKKKAGTNTSGETNQPQNAIQIKTLKRSATSVVLIGDSPLIVHAWSQKAKLEILGKHMGAIKVREFKDPVDDFTRSMYRFDDGNYGFPVVAIKEAMATATIDIEGVDKAKIYRNVSVTGRRGFQLAAFADLNSPHELAEVFSPNPPAIREDMVKLSGIGRVPDIRYRAEFHPWAIRFNLAFMDDFINLDALMNLLARAGFCVGLGEWRQERGGSNGTFHVASPEEVKMVAKWMAQGPKEAPRIDSKKWLAELNARESTKRKPEATTAAAVSPVVAAEAPKRRGRPPKAGNGAAKGH